MADKRVKIIKHNKVAVKFEVDSRYSPLESIGTGAYGVVCAAKDNRTGQRVAIKKIPRVFEVSVIAKRTYRELKILRHFRHENIISILDVMQPPDDLSQFEDVYVVLDLMESDLHHIIHSMQPLSDEHIKFFLYQVLRGLKYIHSANVLHRDLKPSNLLVNRNCELKIGDFGMARGLSSTPDEHATFMTEYVATRWYRAPELMLSFSEYTFAIDIWSVGCIFAEMLGRRQLFPGKDYLNQLQLILSVVGTPDNSYIDGIGSDRVKTYLKNLPSRTRMELAVLFPDSNKMTLDFLDRMLRLDPKSRISAEEALKHDYLTRYHDPNDEPMCMPPFDFSFEKELVSPDDLHKALVEEIMDYHKCRTPIPSQDRVKDALKKMMEDREKEREKVEKTVENGGPVVVQYKEPKDAKEALNVVKAKKAKGGKKRTKQQQQVVMVEEKRIKLEEDDHNSLTNKDTDVLARWKQFQLDTHPFIHPVQKTIKVEDGDLGTPRVSQQELHQQNYQQEIIIKKQAAEIKKLKSELQECQREMEEYAALLKDRHRAVVLKCQVAGVSLPQELLADVKRKHFPTPSSRQMGGSGVPPPSSTQQIISQSNSLLLQSSAALQPHTPPPPPPLSLLTSSTSSTVSNTPTPTLTACSSFSSSVIASRPPAYSNISPTNRTPPTRIPQVPPPPVIQPLPHHPGVSIVTLSPACTVDSILNSSHINPHIMVGGGGVGRSMSGSSRMMPQLHQQQSHHHPALMSVGGGAQLGPAGRMVLADHGRSHIGSLPSRLPYTPGKNVPSNTGPIMLSDISFSPLTSGELKELDNPSEMNEIFVGSTLVPLTEDLDSILNIPMPSGSGAGYGVGVKEEELPRESLQLDLNNLGPATSGPPSASLLRDWLDISQIDPDDMDSLQKELETGAPGMFNIGDLSDL